MPKQDHFFPIDLNKLPPGWAHGPVQDLVVDLRSGFASGLHNDEQIGIPHLRPMNISREGRLDLSVLRYVPEGHSLRVRPGEVLFNNTNSLELVGKTAPIQGEKEFAFSNHMTRLRLPPSLDHRFVAYQLHYLWMSGYFRQRAKQHVNQASISASSLGKTVQLAVAPYAEQLLVVNRIEEEFTRLDATVAALGRVQSNAAHYRTLLVDEASRGRLLPPLVPARHSKRSLERAGNELVRRLAGERQTASDVVLGGEAPLSELPAVGRREAETKLPRGWTTATLDDLSSEKSYGTSLKSDYNSPGPPVLRITNIVNGRLDLSKLKYARLKHGLTKEKQLQPGDLLIVRTNGSKALIGRAALVKESFPRPHFFASYLIRFRLAGAPRLWEWIALMWTSSTVRAAIESAAWTTAGQYNVNLRSLGAISLPIAPEKEQARVLRALRHQFDTLDQLEAGVGENLERAGELRFTILDQAFAGKLTKRQPSPPADRILKNIRDEVAALRESDLHTRLEERMAKRQIRPPASVGEPLKANLLEVMAHTTRPIITEKLFERLGYSFEEEDDVDAFYEQLSSAVRNRRVSVSRLRGKDSSYVKATR